MNRVVKWDKYVDIEPKADAQLALLANLPFIHKYIAVMPDCHAGCGATIGSVIPTNNVIIPAAVGVDIGCGMIAQKLSLKAADLPDNLHGLRTLIESKIPHGGLGVAAGWSNIPLVVEAEWAPLAQDFKVLCDKYPKLIKTNHINHLGTLGTGNHFIEICLDELDNVWIMLHSGSRGVGNAIGRLFISLAKKEMERFYINLPDKDLAYLPHGSKYFDDYVRAVHWAQKYAYINREIMMHFTLEAIREFLPIKFILEDKAVNCHHNYIQQYRSYWLTRKGAMDASKDKLGIIPGAMGRKSYIVKGKGNPKSFFSCSHGAGRTMSRTKAKKIYSVQDHVDNTQGLECKKDESVLDETPMAYKDIDAVMKSQEDLVDIVHTLRAVVCVKG